MTRRRFLLRSIVAVLAAGALTMVGSAPAFAQPANDDFAGATVVGALPFTVTIDTSQATSAPDDPYGCGAEASVWFSFTAAADLLIQADTFGSNYDTALSVWTGSQGSLNRVACNDDYNGATSKVVFSATAGTTYYFLVRDCCWGGGGNLKFSVAEVTPAANDDFSAAVAINGLPFSATADLSTASRETGEPSSCLEGATVWYSFTPTVTGSVTAQVNRYDTGVAAFTGSAVNQLTQVGCRDYYYYPLTFRAEAGRTYYLQVGMSYFSGAGVSTTLSLDVAPDPVANFYQYPNNPNTYDTIRFSDNSQDPGGSSITTWAWDFGDGTTSTLRSPEHRYTTDGDYPVKLTVTTSDGRTGSVTKLVSVRTHDVAIVRLAVPANAHAGQTIAVSAYVSNTNYPETVEMTLSRSTPQGFSQIGSLTQLVTVKTGGQTTKFAFSYTITETDAAIGKITFRAAATLVGSRDALPGDNQLSSTPVTIT
jgi:PKD repeat protein